MNEKREEMIRRWFKMWLEQADLGIDEIFAPEAVYIESWGPEYHGVDKIKLWFDEWNSRGRVKVWEIKGFLHGEVQSMVEWFFQNEMRDGTEEIFDGVSLVEWNSDGKISRLQEFGCNIHRYDPYRNGPTPEFQDGPNLWF